MPPNLNESLLFDEWNQNTVFHERNQNTVFHSCQSSLLDFIVLFPFPLPVVCDGSQIGLQSFTGPIWVNQAKITRKKWTNSSECEEFFIEARVCFASEVRFFHLSDFHRNHWKNFTQWMGRKFLGWPHFLT